MFNDLWQQIVELTGSYLPNLLGALVILIGGWIVALILAAITRGALRRTTLDNRLAEWMSGERAEAVDVERIAGKFVFWLAMIFVLVGFLEVLDLTVVTAPLNALLSEMAAFAPRILGAAVLLAVAWVIAAALRKVVSITLRALDLDRRLGGEAGFDEGKGLPLSNTLAEAIYWFVFLLFLPAVLGALEIQGLLGPVQGLIDELLAFVPNLFAASLILLVGWFVARLVQRVVSNLLAAAGVDALGERIGLEASLGTRQLSGLIGLIVYIFILVPVLIASLEALELDAITVPASGMLAQILTVIPSLFAAVLLLVLAYFVGRLVSELIRTVLAGAGFDNVLGHLGLATETHGRQPSSMVGTLVLVAIMLFAAIEAAGLMGFVSLEALLSSFIYFAGDVILGIIVFGIGLYLARLAAETVQASGVAQAALLSTTARMSIIVLAGAMALRQMGLAEDIINMAFGLLLGAVAVAAALAFGLGSRDLAARQVQRWIGSSE